MPLLYQNPGTCQQLYNVKLVYLCDVVERLVADVAVYPEDRLPDRPIADVIAFLLLFGVTLPLIFKGVTTATIALWLGLFSLPKYSVKIIIKLL